MGLVFEELIRKFAEFSNGQICVESTRTKVGLGEYKRLRYVIPPLDEQKDFSQFLVKKMARLDALTAETSRGFALLKERRSALISVAVIGKVDVRGTTPC